MHSMYGHLKISCPFLYGSERYNKVICSDDVAQVIWHILHLIFNIHSLCTKVSYLLIYNFNTTYIVLNFIEDCLFCDRGIKQIDTFVSLCMSKDYHTFFFTDLIKSPIIIPANAITEEKNNALINTS